MYVFQTFHELLTRICALYQLPARAMRMGEEGEREGEGEREQNKAEGKKERTLPAAATSLRTSIAALR